MEKPPRMIFMPSKSVIKTMVKANLKYGATDTLNQFLLRFGLFLKAPVSVEDESATESDSVQINPDL
jgi:hypothetical protein